MYTPKISQKLECTAMHSNNFGVLTRTLPFTMEFPDHALQNILLHSNLGSVVHSKKNGVLVLSLQKFGVHGPSLECKLTES